MKHPKTRAERREIRRKNLGSDYSKNKRYCYRHNFKTHNSNYSWVDGYQKRRAIIKIGGSDDPRE
jgi:hypothetical protein